MTDGRKVRWSDAFGTYEGTVLQEGPPGIFRVETRKHGVRTEKLLMADRLDYIGPGGEDR